MLQHSVRGTDVQPPPAPDREATRQHRRGEMTLWRPLRPEWLQNIAKKAISAPLPPDRVSRKSYEQELIIANVKKSDEGTYQCTASNSAGAPQTHTVIVNVRLFV